MPRLPSAKLAACAPCRNSCAERRALRSEYKALGTQEAVLLPLFLFPTTKYPIPAMPLFIRHLRMISTTLEWLVVLSLLATSIPLSATSPSWYLRVADTAVSNSPIILLSVLTILLSRAFFPQNDNPNEITQATNRLVSRWALAFAALVPLQLIAYGWLWNDSSRQIRAQLQQTESNLSGLRSQIKASRNTEELKRMFRQGDIGKTPIIGQGSLAEEKDHLNERIELDLITLRSNLTLRRKELLATSFAGSAKTAIGAGIVSALLWTIKREVIAADF